MKRLVIAAVGLALSMKSFLLGFVILIGLTVLAGCGSDDGTRSAEEILKEAALGLAEDTCVAMACDWQVGGQMGLGMTATLAEEEGLSDTGDEYSKALARLCPEFMDRNPFDYYPRDETRCPDEVYYSGEWKKW